MNFRVWDIENKKYLYTPQAVSYALVYLDKYVLECGFTTSVRGEEVTLFEGDICEVDNKTGLRLITFNCSLGCFEHCSSNYLDSVSLKDMFSSHFTNEVIQWFDKVVGNVREGVKDV
jgi:hypothetical protein